MTERPEFVRAVVGCEAWFTPGGVYYVEWWTDYGPYVKDDDGYLSVLRAGHYAPAPHDSDVSATATQHVSPTGGLRSNTGKLPMHLIPTVLPRAVAAVLGKGAEKYEPRNWERGMEFSVCYASLARHLAAYWDGEDIDAESGQPHMAHVATNAAFLLEYARRIASGTLPASLDDRPRP